MGSNPLGVYKLEAPTPLRHYDLNMVALNQKLTEKDLLTIKCQVLTPPKRIYRMKQQVEHVLKKRDPLHICYIWIFSNIIIDHLIFSYIDYISLIRG